MNFVTVYLIFFSALESISATNNNKTFVFENLYNLTYLILNFSVLSEIAEDELAELSQYSSGDPEAERAQAEARRERKRAKITQEMFETEKTYLNHLELINKVSFKQFNLIRFNNYLFFFKLW